MGTGNTKSDGTRAGSLQRMSRTRTDIKLTTIGAADDNGIHTNLKAIMLRLNTETSKAPQAPHEAGPRASKPRAHQNAA